MKDKRIIGVTGGLATGKTTVTDMFVAKGAARIDADEMAHEMLVKNGDLRDKVIGEFGEGILSGGDIDRRKLGHMVFSDRDKLNKLCSIMHPPMIDCIKRQCESLNEKVVILDAPLLIESGLHEYVDVVVVVTAPYEAQIERAIGRGISRCEAANIIKCQMPLSEKVEIADYVIDNGREIEKIKQGVEEIWQKT